MTNPFYKQDKATFSSAFEWDSGGEGRNGNEPNAEQHNQYEKYYLIFFQKVCHYLKKNLYRPHMLIKIYKVLTYLALSPTDRLGFFFYLLLSLQSHFHMKMGYF